MPSESHGVEPQEITMRQLLELGVLVTHGCTRGDLGRGEAILVWTNAYLDTPLVSYGVQFDPSAPHFFSSVGSSVPVSGP